MKKKFLRIIPIIALIFLGIIIGNSYKIGSSNFFEEAKDRFEEEITNPNNNYQPEPIYPKGNLTSDIALKIDNGIESVLGGLFRKLASMLSD